MQAAENIFNGPGISVSYETVATVHTWRPHSRAPIVKWCTSGLWNSLVASEFCHEIYIYDLISGPYWLIRSETRYWKTSCQLIPAWISNHVHVSMGWNYLILIHSQTSSVAPLRFGNGFQHTFYNGCNYSFMQGLKLSHVSKTGISCLRLPVYEHQALSNYLVDMLISGLSAFKCYS